MYDLNHLKALYLNFKNHSKIILVNWLQITIYFLGKYGCGIEGDVHYVFGFLLKFYNHAPMFQENIKNKYLLTQDQIF